MISNRKTAKKLNDISEDLRRSGTVGRHTTFETVHKQGSIIGSSGGGNPVRRAKVTEDAPSGETIKAVLFNSSTGVESSLLDYSSQTGNFTIGLIVTGGTSGAFGTIVADIDNGIAGTLELINVSGTFSAGELLTDTFEGRALANAEQYGIVVYCDISNGSDLSSATPLLIEGNPITVYQAVFNNGGVPETRWFCATNFDTHEECVCNEIAEATIATKTSDYLLTAGDNTIMAKANSEDVTITLPASPAQDKLYMIKCIDATNTCTLARNGNNIEGAASDINLSFLDSWTIQFDSTFGWGRL